MVGKPSKERRSRMGEEGSYTNLQSQKILVFPKNNLGKKGNRGCQFWDLVRVARETAHREVAGLWLPTEEFTRLEWTRRKEGFAISRKGD